MDSQHSVLLSVSWIWSIDGAHWMVFSSCPYIMGAHWCPLKSLAAFCNQVLPAEGWTWTETCHIFKLLSWNLELLQGKYLLSLFWAWPTAVLHNYFVPLLTSKGELSDKGVNTILHKCTHHLSAIFGCRLEFTCCFCYFISCYFMLFNPD